MATDQVEKNKETKTNKDAAVKPDAETLNTTDPQDHMEGPLSSLMHKTGDGFKKEQTKEEVDKKEKNQ